MTARISGQVYGVVARGHPRPFWALIVLLTVSSFMESLGVLSIMPFVAVITNPSMPEKLAAVPLLGAAFSTVGREMLVVGLGAVVVIMAWGVSAMAAYTTLRLIRFAYGQERVLSGRLLDQYMALDYEVYSKTSAPEFVKNILHETHRFVHGVLMPWIQLIAKSTTALCLLAVLLFVDAQATLVCAVLIGVSYFAAWRAARTSLRHHGQQAFEANTRRHRIITEAMLGLKEVQHYAIARRFSAAYAREAAAYVNALVRSDTVAGLPKYVFDALLITIAVAAILLIGAGKGINDSLPVISVFAMAAYRLMPVFHQIFSNVAVIRINEATVPVVTGAILRGRTERRNAHGETLALPAEATPLRVELRDVTYRYPTSAADVLRGISLRLPSQGLLCIVGMSGSGKSTLLDLIAGTTLPGRGSIEVNGQALSTEQLPAWRSLVGLASQHTPLFTGTLEENIVLWPDEQQTDSERLTRCMHAACLARADLPESSDENWHIGDSGRSVSGGQRQRIGIARALYKYSRLVLLDEPTSALDRHLATRIVDSLSQESKLRPVVAVSHDPLLIQRADWVVWLDAGSIRLQGTHSSLMAGSETYRALLALGHQGEEPVALADGQFIPHQAVPHE